MHVRIIKGFAGVKRTIRTNSALFTNLNVTCEMKVISRHLHQCVEEHKNSSSSIGKHFRDKHSLAPKDVTRDINVLMKYTNNFDCLVYKMFFIHA